MGLMSPIILKLKLQSLENACKISGKLNAIATIGGITGTFLGGFFLIPNIGCVQILYILCLALLLLIPLAAKKIKASLTNNGLYLTNVISSIE